MSSRERCSSVVWLSMVCLFSVVGSAWAQSATEIAQAIQPELAKNSDLGNVTLTMTGAVVTLAGEAPSLHTRAQAIDIARRTGGVESVVNDVIIPAAESDQAIAEGMVRALRAYPYLTIWDHVDGVVDNGVVTLEGMVTPYRGQEGPLGQGGGRRPRSGAIGRSNHQAGGMTGMIDLHKRRFTRAQLNVKCPVEMGVRHSSHPACWDGYIKVISERGGFVEVGGDHALGTQVMLRFGFPVIDEVLCTGVVRYHKLGVGIGVEFLGLSDADRGHIGGLVEDVQGL